MALEVLSAVEQCRLEVSKATAASTKARLGQFFTPEATARFMAGMFVPVRGERCRLLDPGAGIGSLTAAFLARWADGSLDFDRVEADLFELDERLHPYLTRTLDACGKSTRFIASIRDGDFVATAVDALGGSLFGEAAPGYTHAILNPPYKKIRSDSAYRAALRKVGIETVNLYSAFVALSLVLLRPGGQLVAIIPRSFCNGPYYRSFRRFVLERAALRQMHLFAARDRAFRDDAVLQENLIILLERGGRQGAVTVTTSTDDRFTDVETHRHPFERIVHPGDAEQFIHVPDSEERTLIEEAPSIRSSLEDLRTQVSTGPVVDFRVKEHLRSMPAGDTVPLLYPGHFSGPETFWPRPGWKKANAIQRNSETERWLYPNGFYCVVRRFSSKEEKRRIVASVVRPDSFPGAEMLGFENHLNVFHRDRQGLPEELAYGLATYLNTTAVDESFRRFNGHTQVNATDLRLMTYLAEQDLVRLGRWAIRRGSLTQLMIDQQLSSLIA